ncbi:MAG: hypothetical protein ACLS9G_00035 [Akkermansia sp.]
MKNTFVPTSLPKRGFFGLGWGSPSSGALWTATAAASVESVPGHTVFTIIIPTINNHGKINIICVDDQPEVLD